MIKHVHESLIDYNEDLLMSRINEFKFEPKKEEKDKKDDKKDEKEKDKKDTKNQGKNVDPAEKKKMSEDQKLARDIMKGVKANFKKLSADVKGIKHIAQIWKNLEQTKAKMEQKINTTIDVWPMYKKRHIVVLYTAKDGQPALAIFNRDAKTPDEQLILRTADKQAIEEFKNFKSEIKAKYTEEKNKFVTAQKQKKENEERAKKQAAMADFLKEEKKEEDKKEE